MIKKKSYISGLVGALIGGLIASIPWILMYTYSGRLISSFLTVIIGFGVLKGYQLFNGKIDDKLPIIVIIVTMVCVTMSIVIVIPLFFQTIDFDLSIIHPHLKKWYNSSNYLQNIICALIPSEIFSIIWLKKPFMEIKKQVQNNNYDNIKISVINNQEQVQDIKNIFLELGAIDKENAKSKEEIFEYINDSNLKTLFDKLLLQEYIVKYKNKYYYSLEYEQKPIKRSLKILYKIMIVAVIGIIFIILLVDFVIQFHHDDNASDIIYEGNNLYQEFVDRYAQNKK